ncbi:MAG: DUF4954 family protein, partial [Planctomycetes bacterium]|nr:DUF4954 family protein [Planctomycetota bacterium]
MDQCQSYQPITQDQIDTLTSQGVTADDWQRLLVADGFSPARVRNTHFAGDVLIGSQQNHIPLTGNPAAPTGICNASIHNCTIGSEVYIDRASIANYDIA